MSQYNQVPSVQGHLNVHGTFVPKNFNVTHFTSFVPSVNYRNVTLKWYTDACFHILVN